MLLACNLHSAMKRLVLGGQWVRKRLRAIRYTIICRAGRVLEHGRRLIVRLAGGQPSNEVLCRARARILAMAEPSTG